MFTLFSKNGIGFTLTELLVIAGIILLLSAIILPNYRLGQRQFALQRSSHKLAQDLRRAQEMAMSAKKFKGITVPGYGIYFNADSDEIILFADCNGDLEFNFDLEGNPAEVCGESGSIFSENLEGLKLEPGIQIKELSPHSPLNITFRPPEPRVFLEGATEAIITLSFKTDTTKTKIITVNSSGLIAIE